MSAVQLIQKIGQVPFSTLVEHAAAQGFVLAGSPTLISNVVAQLMIHTGHVAKAPEYMMVEKTGQLKLSHQVADLLDEGWEIYGSMVAGPMPMQAMVRGDIGVHRMYGMGNDPVDTGDWAAAIKKARDDAVAECKAYTDELLETLSLTVNQHAETGATELASLVEAFAEEKQVHRDGIQLQAAKNRRVDEVISELDMRIQMEGEERRTDIDRVEQMILASQKDMPVTDPVVPAAARTVAPKSAEYPPIVPAGSVWK